jgi:hypothetical protein
LKNDQLLLKQKHIKLIKEIVAMKLKEKDIVIKEKDLFCFFKKGNRD